MNEHHRNCVIDNGFVFFTPLWFWFGAFIKNGKLTHKKHIFNYDEVYIFVYTVQCTLIYIRFYMQWCFVTGQFFESGCVRCWANSNNNKKRIVCEFPTKIIGREHRTIIENRTCEQYSVQSVSCMAFDWIPKSSTHQLNTTDSWCLFYGMQFKRFII